MWKIKLTRGVYRQEWQDGSCNRTLLLCSYNLRFPAICNIFSGPFNFPIYIVYCLPQFYIFNIQTSRDLHVWSVYMGSSFGIKWHLLRDCLYLHVSSCTTITIRWSVIQLRQICILLYRTKVAFLFDNY
jgi:hypothetical protein